VPREGNFELCLRNESTKLGYHSQCQWFLADRVAPPQVEISINDGDTVQFKSTVLKQPPGSDLEFIWSTFDFGPSLKLPKERVIDQEICLKVRDKNKRYESTNCVMLRQEIQRFNIKSQFDISQFVEITPSMSVANAVEIEYIDAASQVFRSDRFRQPEASQFTITAISDYKDPITEEALKKLEITFDCVLYSDTGEMIKIENGTGSIALSYPQ